MHEPVLLGEVVEGLALKPGQIVVDGTAGSGGHAEQLLRAVGSSGRLIALDRDVDAIKRCQERFRAERERVSIQQAVFRELDKVLSALGVGQVEGILLDLGVSKEQLEVPERGFSFLRDGPLDMRMDRGLRLKAESILQSTSEKELADILWQFGEERRSRWIASRICQERSKNPITSTLELAELVQRVVGRKGRRHPATKTFQALRIAVNDELNELREGLDVAVNQLAPGGRLAVITYHSLEDRIVKRAFQKFKLEKKVLWVTKKPIPPSREEILRNPSSRSAKLRIVERLVS